jgi:VanZ family protein
MKPWQRQPSTFARQALAGLVALMVYASLYPFTDWRSLGISPFAYLLAPPQQYVTVFDVLSNVLGYMPFGALMVIALYPRWRPATATVLACLSGAVLSASMEAIQTYLPTRVASNLDLGANALGALAGAFLMAPLTSPLLDRGWLRRLRLAWGRRHASFVLGLVLLWPFAQIFPQPLLFGTGDWPRVLWEHLDVSVQGAMLNWAPALVNWPDRLGAGLAPQWWEALVSGLNVLAVCLLATLAMRPSAPRVRLLLALLVTTLIIKAGATLLQSQSGLWLGWLTGAGQVGMLLGLAAALATLRLPGIWRAALAYAALVLAIALVNLLPVDPYYDAVLTDWRQGRYLHFNGLAQWLSWTWPFAALVWLAHSAERAWGVRRRRG